MLVVFSLASQRVSRHCLLPSSAVTSLLHTRTFRSHSRRNKVTNNMKFFGHRGASAREAENTLASLSRALAESDGAEFDVQRTSDNVLVVLHDDTLARTAVAWNNNNSLSEAEYFEVVNTPVNLLSWATVRSIRVGKPHAPFTLSTPQHALEDAAESKSEYASDILACNNNKHTEEEDGQLLMTLPEALTLLVEQHPSKTYLVEVKGGDLEAAPLVARDIARSGATPQQARLIGFDLATMCAVKQFLPLYHCSHIVHQDEDAEATEALVHAAADAGLDSVDLKACPITVTAALVATAHQRGLEVLVWVLKKESFDHVQAWNTLAGRGVDLFTSDLPTEAFEWWQQRRELKLLQLKLMKQKQAQRRRAMPAVPMPSSSPPSSPPLSPSSSPSYSPQLHNKTLTTIQEGREKAFDDPFGAMTPPDGSVVFTSSHSTTTECLRSCCAPDRFRSSATAGDLILSLPTSPSYFGNFNAGVAAAAAASRRRRATASSRGPASSLTNFDCGIGTGQKLKPMPKFRRPWNEGSAAHANLLVSTGNRTSSE